MKYLCIKVTILCSVFVAPLYALDDALCALDHPDTSLVVRCSCHSISDREREENTKLNNNLKVVLNAFATILGGIIAIKQDPHNPEHVGSQVNNMVSSLIHVGIQASRMQTKGATEPTIKMFYTEQLTALLIPFLLQVINNGVQKI